MQKEFIMSLGLEEQVADAILTEHQKITQGYEEKLRSVTVDAAVRQAVTAAGGRNLTAIRALMDVSALGDDPERGAALAVAAVKRENPYLFAGAQVTSPGTGSPAPMGYSHEELGKLPLSEYRRYRKGM